MNRSAKGICIIYIGNGKGKTTAALGLACRCIGQGGSVCICQFLKSDKTTGEAKFFSDMPSSEIHVLGRGFVTDSLSQKEREKHCQAACDAVKLLEEKLLSARYRLVIADELLDAVALGFVDVDTVVRLQSNLSPGTTLVITGRTATQSILDQADTVTEMKEVKHHYQKGIKAVRGIEY
ncbi:MAG: cob(I)yrinic acid a,c-diamide adenosyltransferase [Candidatus Auribacterota bacterium]|jgi:cob(I)alamin adenosyltransferase|nr:cob(I)yrinic acid a,c-diamide adenosyltransferase [Candidatus Auribacterota bacterium]